MCTTQQPTAGLHGDSADTSKCGALVHSIMLRASHSTYSQHLYTVDHEGGSETHLFERDARVGLSVKYIQHS